MTGHVTADTADTATGGDAAGRETDTGPGTFGAGSGAAAAGTGRDAILRAARRAFTLRPYAEVTMRGIAADAGVSASLIVKRFGTKAELFRLVADFAPAADALFAAPLGELGRHLVLTLVRSKRAQQADPLLRVVFSLGNRDERALLQERFRAQVTTRLAERLPGPEADLRAELVVGQLLGLGATLSLHRPGAGVEATPEHLADLCAPALQRLIDD
ncbi:TetR family transcriptional regulator [Streptomyces sp. NPDC091272]|uniref:TetR/AcrR family transcriptional regulator n=1 Tax=Streptomyces sp. NPDC091272 TaxID=3365981 RepID=UPI00381ACA2F